MTGSARNTCVCSTAAEERRARIRALNDNLRRHLHGGTILMTSGVRVLSLPDIEAAVLAVRGFRAFTPDNDPFGEHDLGSFKVGGRKFFWKIDYYDLERRYGSPDPSDPNVTARVLTIMLASEY